VSEHERLDRLIAAEQDERRRLALFLHDGPVQQLAGIALMLDAVVYSIASGRVEEAQQILRNALEHHRQTIRELRDLSFVLEPVVLRDQGFAPALRALTDQVGRSHELRIDLDIDEASILGETAQVALYTIIRELLDQSIRRGPPSRIEVRLARTEDGGAVVVVIDDAEPERRRRSFEAIEERVSQLHGEIEVVARAGGTEIRVTIPSYNAQR
jgi:signal transduction histidine kinase